MATWHVVVVARGLTAGNEPLWAQLEKLGASVAVVDSGASQPLMRRASKFGTYVRVERPAFNWAICANAGVSVAPRDTERLLFLHDDVLLTNNAVMLDALARALDGEEVGLAVPTLTGACRTAAQAWVGPWFAPYYHTTEYVSGAVVAVTMRLFREVGGWDDRLDGADWHAPEMQLKLAERGYIAAVVPMASAYHAGGATYGEARAERLHNQQAFCNAHGIGSEFGMRPTLPRIAPAATGSECWIVNGVTDEFVATLSDYRETVIVDCDPQPGLDWTALFDAARYSPCIDGRADVFAVNLAGSADVEIHDAREGAPAITFGKRLRLGDEYRLPQQVEQLDWGMMRGCGIGDFLMMTPAIARFHVEHPDARIVAHGPWEAVTVLENLPEIAEVIWHRTGPIGLPPGMMDFAGGNGREGTIRWPYYPLGLDPDEDPDRRMRYRVRAEEFERAVAWLRSVGVGDEPLLGLQAHGSWRVKQWDHTLMLSALWQKAGGRVVLFRTVEERTPPCVGADVLPAMSIRDALAVLSVCDCWVGHDSGPTLAAAAMRIPSVALVGSHDPKGLLMDARAENVVVFRARTPAQCRSVHGVSCRDGRMGDYCPLRPEGAFGGDCLDAVSAEQVMAELAQMPRWSRPLEERFGGGIG
jgi:hypothetical protein